MGISSYSLEQRFEFIKDCYKSGLSIPAWCHDNNIALGTFYGWIKQVTSRGYEIPDSLNYHPAVKRQEVVKLPIIDDIRADSYMNDFPSFNDTDADKPLCCHPGPGRPGQCGEPERCSPVGGLAFRYHPAGRVRQPGHPVQRGRRRACPL